MIKIEDIGQKKIRHANQVFPVGELELGRLSSDFLNIYFVCMHANEIS